MIPFPTRSTTTILAFFLATAIPSYCRAEVDLSLVKSVRGTVTSVGPDSYMHIAIDNGIEEQQFVAVRNWGLNISPSALRILVLGRRIYCVEMYQVNDRVAANCSIVGEYGNQEKAFPSSGSVLRISVLFGLGFFECNKQDLAAGQTGLFTSDANTCKKAEEALSR